MMKRRSYWKGELKKALLQALEEKWKARQKSSWPERVVVRLEISKALDS